MNKLKQILSAMLGVCLTLSLLSETALADSYEPDVVHPYSVTGGNIYYYIYAGEAVIYSSNKTITEAIIPSEIDGMPVDCV